MADVQIKPLGTEAAPAAWTLPGNLELLVKRCFAHYDGTGAAGSFLPTLRVRDDAGRNVLEVPMDASVAAGSSVEASWAPFLRSASTSSTPTSGGTPTTACFWRSESLAPFDPVLTIAAGATVTIPWLHASLPSDGSITGPTTGSTRAQFNMDCICTHELHVAWDDGSYLKAAYLGTQSRVVVADDAGFPNVGFPAMGAASIDGFSWCYAHRDDSKLNTDELFAYVYNGDTVSHDVHEAWLLIHAWAAPGIPSTPPRWPV